MPDVTFKSDAFETLTPVDDAINGMLGHDVAVWMHANLQARGFDVDQVIYEDYGFGFWLKHEQAHYWVWHTRYDPTDDDHDDHALWVIGVNDDAGCLWARWLKQRPEPATSTTIVHAIHDILTNTPHITDIVWWEKDLGQGTPSSEPS